MARLIDLDKEVWKPIPGFEEYQVSSEGRVKSVMRYARSGKGLRRVPEKLMTLSLHPESGHWRVQLSKQGKTKTFVVYKLVMEIHKQEEKPEGSHIAHLDGDTGNNSMANLAWQAKGSAGVTHQKASLNENDVEEIRSLRQSGMSVDQIATKMQISKAQVSKIANRKSRQNI